MIVEDQPAFLHAKFTNLLHHLLAIGHSVPELAWELGPVQLMAMVRGHLLPYKSLLAEGNMDELAAQMSRDGVGQLLGMEQLKGDDTRGQI